MSVNLNEENRNQLLVVVSYLRINRETNTWRRTGVAIDQRDEDVSERFADPVIEREEFPGAEQIRATAMVFDPDAVDPTVDNLLGDTSNAITRCDQAMSDQFPGSTIVDL